MIQNFVDSKLILAKFISLRIRRRVCFCIKLSSNALFRFETYKIPNDSFMSKLNVKSGIQCKLFSWTVFAALGHTTIKERFLCGL